MAETKVSSNEIALDGANSFVFTDQTTTSTTYTDLATIGPSATVMVGQSGKVLVSWSCGLYTGAYSKFCGIALSGANTIAPVDDESIRKDDASFTVTTSRTKLFTGLTPGSTTFTMKYRVGTASTGNFFSRNLTVIPL